MKPQINNPAVRFLVVFITLFLLFYYFNIAFFSLTSPGSRHYTAFLDKHLNYIDGLRWLLLTSSAKILHGLGYVAITNKYELLVAGKGFIRVVYTCLGLGVLSFFAAFVIAYPKPLKAKLIFLIGGMTGIQLLNLLRFIGVALFWNSHRNKVIDHHTLFNIFIYIAIAAALYFWIKADPGGEKNAAN